MRALFIMHYFETRVMACNAHISSTKHFYEQTFFEYHTKNGANSTTLTKGEVETRESKTRRLSVNSVADSLSLYLFTLSSCQVIFQ